ncbi:MAG: Ig-like domain-containing protein [Oscillospiraceae bacterium]|nr:Ig-like domain-containing protein [Oscillospiraceae bacterium]
MSENRCPRCGKSYPSSYRSCPYCSGRSRGRRQPETPLEQIVLFLRENGERVFLTVTAVFLVMAVFGMILTRCSSEPDPAPKPDPDSQTEEPEDPQPAADPLKLSTMTLSLSVGESAVLSAEGGAEPEAELTWSSSDETVAAVADGLVTAAGAGSATITVTRGTEWTFCVVTVKEKDPDVEVYLNRTDFTLRQGENTFQMEVKVRETRRAYEGNVVWSVEDPSVATVSETGLIQRVGRGNTKVTATMGTKVLECIVRVK